MADVPSSGVTVNPKTTFVNSAASTNATSVKGAAGVLVSVTASTVQTAATRYVKFYNKATAPTVGTDVPVLVLTIPANSTTAATTCGLVRFEVPAGLKFSTGIAMAITGLAADSDTTAVAANDVKVALVYI